MELKQSDIHGYRISHGIKESNFSFFFKFYFIFKLYIIVLVLPNIKMKLVEKKFINICHVPGTVGCY